MEPYRVVREIDRSEWSEFVLNHPQGSVFQSPDMFDLFGQTTHYTPVFLAVRDEHDTVAAVLLAVIQKESAGIIGYFSSRAIVFGGPLIKMMAANEQLIVMEKLLAELVKIVKRKAIYIQFRNFFAAWFYEPVFEKYHFTFREHLNLIVATSSREVTEKNISKSKMRQVRKSLKSGATIIEPENIEQVKAFFHLLQDLYKRRIKLPLPGWSFFSTFYHMSREGRIGKYFLVEYNKEIIGGIMCPMLNKSSPENKFPAHSHTGHESIYEWYVCGLDEGYKDKGIYPSVLATWAAVDYALKKGLKYFDFMGAGKPDRDYGVREFKAKFGGKLVQYGRYERINNRLLYRFGKLGLKILGAFKG